MSKKKRRIAPAAVSNESRAAELATVAWMLVVLTTLVCGSLSAAVWLFARSDAGGERAMLFARYMHFSSIVTAVLSLLLMAVVFKTRRERPPQSITIFAIVVAIAPLLAIFF